MSDNTVADNSATNTSATNNTVTESPLKDTLVDSSTLYFEGQLTQVLQEMMTAGGLLGAVLTSTDGLPLAALESDASPDVLAGLSSLFAEVARRSEQLLDWQVEEVSLVNQKGIRLVTRQFKDDDNYYILVVVVPAQKTYRRVTNIAVKKLRELMRRPNSSQ